MKMQLARLQRKTDTVDRDESSVDLARVAGALQPQAFLLDADAVDGESALRLAARFVGRTHGLSETLVFDALWRREQAASTALGAGFAIPHARLPGIERAITIFIRLRDAIAFGAADGLPVSCLLVILVPRDGADGDHLQMLSLIAKLFSMRSFRKQIDKASTAAMADAAFKAGIAKSIGTMRVSHLFG